MLNTLRLNLKLVMLITLLTTPFIINPAEFTLPGMSNYVLLHALQIKRALFHDFLTYPNLSLVPISNICKLYLSKCISHYLEPFYEHGCNLNSHKSLHETCLLPTCLLEILRLFVTM